MSQREEAGHCEACAAPIYEMDAYCPCSDGVMLCEEHAASLSDVLRQYQEIAADANPILPGEMDTREELLAAIADIGAEIAATGDRKILVTA